MLPRCQRRREDTARAAAIETLTKEEYDDQLGLALNTQILWNTRDPQRARDAERATGWRGAPEDSAWLSPLGLDPSTILGRYQFMAPESARRVPSSVWSSHVRGVTRCTGAPLRDTRVLLVSP